MSRKLIFKLIGVVYTEYLAQNQLNLQDFNSTFHLRGNLSSYIYEHLLNQYGIEKMAEKKINQFLRGIINCTDSPRICLLEKFINPNQIDAGSFEFYLKGVYFLNNLYTNI